MRLKLFSACLAVCLLAGIFAPCASAAGTPPEIEAPSAILIEQSTGNILFEKNPDEQLPPASVTKIMTLLLTMEAVDSGKISMEDIIVCDEKVSKMEGSRVFLSLGEKISVHELIKSVAVASGNDAAVALAQHIAGSEEGFVGLMNERAAQLGMTNTHFINCTGLDAEGHLTTARDISIMSRELLKHEKILEYTTIWMDSLRDGKFTLANTNRLIRFYEGANGLKTGSTGNAKYCLSGAAKRDGMQLIAVVLASPTSAQRFEDAKALLDFGFANYGVLSGVGETESIDPVTVLKGKKDTVNVTTEGPLQFLVEKGKEEMVEKRIEIAADLEAPVELGQKVGEICYLLEGQELGRVKIVTSEAVERLSFGDIFGRLLSALMMVK